MSFITGGSGPAVNTFIHGRTRYQVVAACVIAKLTSGSETYVYKNGILPVGIERSQLDHLLNLGMVTEIAGSN